MSKNINVYVNKEIDALLGSTSYSKVANQLIRLCFRKHNTENITREEILDNLLQNTTYTELINYIVNSKTNERLLLDTVNANLYQLQILFGTTANAETLIKTTHTLEYSVDNILKLFGLCLVKGKLELRPLKEILYDSIQSDK